MSRLAKPRIISVHAFRRATGKSTLIVNLAALYVSQGYRVGMVDIDLQTPSLHYYLLGQDLSQTRFSLQDYLWGECSIEDTVYDVTARLGDDLPGKAFLSPLSLNINDLARLLRKGYDIARLSDGFNALLEQYKLDILLLDTQPGLQEESLLAIAVSDLLLIALRPDQQHFQGTAILVEVARKLNVPKIAMLVNDTPDSMDFEQVKAEVEQAYACEVAAVLPHLEEGYLENASLFVLRHPEHPFSIAMEKAARRLLENETSNLGR